MVIYNGIVIFIRVLCLQYVQYNVVVTALQNGMQDDDQWSEW